MINFVAIQSLSVIHKITTVSNLLSELNSCDGDDYKKVVKNLAIPISEFEPYSFGIRSSIPAIAFVEHQITN